MRSARSLTTKIPSLDSLSEPGVVRKPKRFARLRKTRLYARFRKAKLSVWYRFQDLLIVLGIEQRLATEDRRVLETVILPYLQAQPSLKRVLFIGCAWYTRGYRRFFDEETYWTLDIDPARKRFGAKKHVVDALENIERHFAADSLDLIICNGVFGWGLNDRAVVEQAFHGCHRCLRPGGMFVLGWNDLAEARPFPLEESKSLALFRPAIFPPLAASHVAINTEYRHVYDFFVK